MTAPPLKVWYPEIIFVVEGAARALATPGRPSRGAHADAPHTGEAAVPAAPPGAVTAAVQVVAAPRSGDDTIAELAAKVRGIRLVVTADRELRRRCEAAGAAVTGPRWLLSLL